MRQKERTEMASVIPQVHLSRGLDVYQTRRLPLSLELQDKKVGLLLRKTRGVFQSAVCALPWVGWSICHRPVGLRDASPPAHESQAISVSCVPDQKPRAPGTCKNSSPGNADALE